MPMAGYKKCFRFFSIKYAFFNFFWYCRNAHESWTQANTMNSRGSFMVIPFGYDMKYKSLER